MNANLEGFILLKREKKVSSTKKRAWSFAFYSFLRLRRRIRKSQLQKSLEI